MTAVQSQITSIRDSIQRRRQGQGTGRPLGFTGEPSDDRVSNPLDGESFYDALGYAKNDKRRAPIYKAPAPVQAAPVVSVWAQGFGDRERRTGDFNGIDIGRRTLTGGGVGGLDVIFSNVTGISDVVVLGVLGAGMKSTTHNNDGSEARVDGPGTGAYAMYINGGFSTDVVWKGDFLVVAPSTLPTSLGLKNYTTAWNINYKSNYGRWWLEPTAGALYTQTVWNDTAHIIGFIDGHSWRVQGGARIGTSYSAGGGVTVEPTLTALLYDDVRIEGGTLAAVLTPQAPTDQDKVFGQLIGKLNADFGAGLSSYVEGEVRGREHVLGLAARIGVRKSFQ
jgi:hypothetical protein